MSENILYLLASEKMNRDLYRKYFIEQHLVEEINEKDEMGQTALGEAIDYRNWILVRLMMQSPIRRKTIIHAIGELRQFTRTIGIMGHFLLINSFF